MDERTWKRVDEHALKRVSEILDEREPHLWGVLKDRQDVSPTGYWHVVAEDAAINLLNASYIHGTKDGGLLSAPERRSGKDRRSHGRSTIERRLPAGKTSLDFYGMVSSAMKKPGWHKYDYPGKRPTLDPEHRELILRLMVRAYKEGIQKSMKRE